MGMGFLEGSTRDRPRLPLRGKATTLIGYYGAVEISRAEFEHVQSLNEWGSDDQLVIVFRHGPHDEALLVTAEDFAHLRANTRWLTAPGARQPRFLLMPRGLALELAGLRKSPLHIPEGQ